MLEKKPPIIHWNDIMLTLIDKCQGGIKKKTKNEIHSTKPGSLRCTCTSMYIYDNALQLCNAHDTILY